MKRIISVFLCMVMLTGIFASCKRDNGPVVPTADTVEDTTALTHAEKAKQIKIGYFQEKALNPFETNSPLNRNLSALVYDSLFVIEDDFSALPLIAEDFTNEGKKLTVQIAEQLYFSDGSPLTAKDVVYSFRLAKESAFFGKRLSNIATATSGENSVIFTLKNSHINAESDLVFPIVKSGTGEKKYPTGSGRYKFKKIDGELYLKANENSTRGEEMLVDTIRLTPVSADESEIYLLQTGDLTTFYDDLSDGSFTKINVNMERVPLNNLVFIGFNNKKKFLKDTAVKKAIELCTDKKTICDAAFDGYCRLSDTIFNPSWSVTLENEKYESVFSVMEAKDVLQNAGYIYAYNHNKYRSKNFEFLKLKFIVCKDSKSKVEAAELITKNMRSAGIEVTLQKLSFDEYSQAVKYGDYDLYLGEVALSPSMDLSVFFSPDGELSSGIEADSAVSGAYFDYASGTIDYSTFNQVIIHEKPFIPICYRDGMVCFSRELSYEGSVNQYDIYKNAYSWELKSATDDILP